REKASFLKENLLPMEDSGQLCFLERGDHTFQEATELGFGILFVDGHTEKQMIPHIQYMGKTIVFMADLLPTVGHIPLPYVMGYDTRPLLTLAEKDLFLKNAADRDYFLFFEHDAHHELCTLQRTEKGIRSKELFSFRELFG
ncbi:MAG: MBL fold metallo-hydrolase, partial [Flavobacteriaceae bacterium]